MEHTTEQPTEQPTDEERQEECKEEMNKLRAIENEVDVDTITMKELKKSGVKLKAVLLFVLDWFIVDNVKEEEGAAPDSVPMPTSEPTPAAQ